MTLTGLRPLLDSAREHRVTYAMFEFRKNKLDFHVFFDFGTSPYRLGFLLKKSSFNFWIDVQKGFIIRPFLEIEQLVELMVLLEIKPNPDNKFKLTAFFQEFNNQIPSVYSSPDKNILNQIACNQYKIEEQDNLYLLCVKTWLRKERSPQNTEKTRLLYPELFESIKERKNISVCYTFVKNPNEDNIISNLKIPMATNK